MARPRFVWDGVDFSTKINKRNYSVTSVQRNGNNGGLMLSGDEVVDFLKWADVITVTTNGMSAADTATFLAALKRSTTRQLTYTNPETGTTRTITCQPPEINAVPWAMSNAQGTSFYGGYIVTLTEV